MKLRLPIRSVTLWLTLILFGCFVQPLAAQQYHPALIIGTDENSNAIYWSVEELQDRLGLYKSDTARWRLDRRQAATVV